LRYNARMTTETKQSQQKTVEKQQLSEADRLARLQEHARTVLAPHQFKPGHTGNPNGRPRDPVKEIGKRIARARAGKTLTDKERRIAKELGFDTEDITVLEQLMLGLAMSKNPNKIALYLERTYGKVPNININAEVNAALVTKFRSKFTDAELEAIAEGANPMELLFDKLPDVDDAPRLGEDDEDVIDASSTEDE